MNEMPLGPPPQPRYLTYISDRGPRYKFHNDIGQAKNAVGYGRWNWCRGGQIFEWTLIEPMRMGWNLIYDIPRGTHRGDLPWNREKTRMREAAEVERHRTEQRRSAMMVVEELNKLD